MPTIQDEVKELIEQGLEHQMRPDVIVSQAMRLLKARDVTATLDLTDIAAGALTIRF